MADSPPPDPTARGYAVDLEISEGRAAYHLEKLCEVGFARARGYVGGGGYEITQTGLSYLVDNHFI
jgi:repressor of nif and glnA expression